MLDPHDGKELLVMDRLEKEKREHIDKYGSFLFCPERDVLCSFMENVWKTGEDCGRRPCILDDPWYQKLQERIRKNLARQSKKRPKEEKAAPIRRQTKSWKDLQWEKIHRLETESARAYRENRPKVGEDKLNQAIRLERELRGKEDSDVRQTD